MARTYADIALEASWDAFEDPDVNPARHRYEVARNALFGVRPHVRDWHARRGRHEPDCGPHQWRKRDRTDVVNICNMSNGHLAHALRFAEKPQHESRRAALLAERDARRLNPPSL